MDNLKEYLTELANEKAWIDDPHFMIDDYAGGNIDDSYAGGMDDGQILLARSLLKEYFNDHEQFELAPF